LSGEKGVAFAIDEQKAHLKSNVVKHVAISSRAIAEFAIPQLP
jgi:hypothetical protein